MVIKYGGAAMEDPQLREEFARDVVLLKYVGLNPIVVHGGGPDITAYMERLGLPVEFVDGLRVSNAETVEVAKMVLLGKVNKDIVLRLGRHGQPAVGLSGDDGRLFSVERKAAPERSRHRLCRAHRARRRQRPAARRERLHPGRRLGRRRCRRRLLQRQRRRGGRRGGGAIRAYKVVFLTDVPGWLRDPADPASVISETTPDEIEAVIDAVAGGMRPKLQACIDAIRGGAGCAVTSSTVASSTRSCSSCSPTPDRDAGRLGAMSSGGGSAGGSLVRRSRTCRRWPSAR